jgi:hypothetical protein
MARTASASTHDISDFIQFVLKVRKLPCVTAVTAAEWLNSVGILRDSPQRPGLPLRRLLRAGKIRGQHQESNSRWSINALSHE